MSLFGKPSVPNTYYVPGKPKRIVKPWLAILLVVLFGPIGLIYASPKGGMILFFIHLFLRILARRMLPDPSTAIYFIMVSAWASSLIWAIVVIRKNRREELSGA